MTYEFLAEAKAEFWEAAERYESKEAGLGVRFRVEVAHVIERVVADPFLWRERPGGYRRVKDVVSLMPLFSLVSVLSSQRDKINQPRVARNELPWVNDSEVPPTLKGLNQSHTYRSSNSIS